jgi:hypothetical protein
MQTALLWVVVVIGPDFLVEPRWAPQQFTDRAQCEHWVAETVRNGSVKLRSDVRTECATTGSAEIEE